MKYLSTDFQNQLMHSVKLSTSASEIIGILDDINAATFKANSDTDTKVEKLKVISPELGSLISGNPDETKREIIKEAREVLVDSDRIRIEMSYMPSKDFLYGLYEIFQTLGYKGFLFEVFADPSVGTGAKFYHKGNFIDVSMLELIKEKMKGTDLGKII